MQEFLLHIDSINTIFWEYIGLAIIFIMGAYLTIISRGFQFRALWNFRRDIREIIERASGESTMGIHPLKLFFTSVGGMVGIGNIVSVGTAVLIGGPGSILWLWITAFAGMMIKYCEIYLGLKYRIVETDGQYRGGPMYFLQTAFNSKALAYIFAILFCFYGVEVYQFAVIVERVSNTFNLNHFIVLAVVLAMTLYTTIGGIQRLADICTIFTPIFLASYIAVCFYIIGSNINLLPTVVLDIVKGAFLGHAPIGGFVGSVMMVSASTGVMRAVYAADIGIGYDAIVQSETKIQEPKYQALISIYALVTDMVICTMTTLLFAITGAWHKMNHLGSDIVITNILDSYIPYADEFITILLFMAGFTTVVAYFGAGIRTASYLSKKYGKWIYTIYAIITFIFFSYYSAEQVMPLMLFCAGLLVIINISAVIKLIKEVKF